LLRREDANLELSVTRTNQRRRRFAVLVNSLEGRYQSDILRGIRTELRAEADLLVVVTPTLGRGLEDPELLLQRLPSPKLVDGIIVLAGTLGLTEGDLERVAQHWEHAAGSRAAMVSVGVACNVAPSVVVDDGSGVREAVTHLIEHHGFSHIAFLCGPHAHPEAERRRCAYQATLLERGLYREDYVVFDGDFSFRWGNVKTVELLNTWPNVQAIVAANDEMGRGALSAIEDLDRQTPPAVVGFDDTEYARAARPPLTTVRQPLEEEGRLAARALLELVAGGTPAAKVILPTKLQIRRSCTCERSVTVSSDVRRSEIEEQVRQFVPNRREARAFMRRFAGLLRASKKMQSDAAWQTEAREVEARATRFLERRLAMATSVDIGVWETALDDLRSSSLLVTPEGDRKGRVYEFWMELLRLTSRRGQELAARVEHHRRDLREMRDDLEAVCAENEAKAVIGRCLPRLGIAGYWLSLRDGPEHAKILASSSDVEAENTFPAWMLVPEGDMPAEAVTYGFESGTRTGHLTFGLGEQNDWPSYAEIAERFSRAFGGTATVRSTPTSSSKPPSGRPPSYFPPGPTGAQLPSIGELHALKRWVGDELAVLQSVLGFNRASVQLVSGEARTLLAALGFSEESPNRSLLRPIAADPLISRIIEQGAPLLSARIRDVPGWNEHTNQSGDIESWIGAPVFHDDVLVGLLTFDFLRPEPGIQRFAPRVAKFSERIAPMLAQALPLARERQLNDLISIVQRTIEIIGEQLDPDGLLEAIATQVANHLNCSHCTIFFPKKENGRHLLAAEYTSDRRRKTRTFERNDTGWEGLAGWVFEHGDKLVLTDAHRDPRFAPARPAFENSRPQGDEPSRGDAAPQERSRSMLVVPIKVGRQTIGVISADQDAYAWFQQHDARLVEALAVQAGIAIQRARSVKFLQDIATGILSSVNVREILEKVVKHAIELMNATTGVIYHLTPDQRAIRAKYHPEDFNHPEPRLDKEDGLTRTILREKKRIMISRVKTDPRTHPKLHECFESMIGVPLMIANHVIGVLYVDDRDAHPFTDAEISLLEILANQAAIAIQNATLVEESREEFERHKRLEVQLERLHEIVGARNREGILNRVVEGISVILGDEVSSTLNLVNQQTGEFEDECHAYGKLASALRSKPRRTGTGRHVLDTRRPVYHSNVHEPPEGPPIRNEAILVHGIQSFAAVPLIHHPQEKPVGVLFVNSRRKLEFGADETRVLTLFAGHAAVAVSNSYRYAQAQRRYKRVAAEAGRKLNARLTHFAGIEHQLANEAKDLLPQPENIQRINKRLRETTAGLRRLVSDFERFGKPLKPQLVRCSLNDVVGSVIRDARARQMQVQIDLSTMSLNVDIDPKLIVFALEQLLDNADRAVAGATTREIWVTTYQESSLDGTWAIVRLDDSGPGFPPEVTGQEPFESSDLERSGVGLAMVNDIAHEHGGELRLCKSDKWGGAAVELRLPWNPSNG